MILVQEAKKFRVESEVEAIDLINDFKNKARQEGYEVKTKDFMKISVPFTLTAVLSGYLFIWIFWGLL